jgi:hypothetical protein
MKLLQKVMQHKQGHRCQARADARAGKILDPSLDLNVRGSKVTSYTVWGFLSNTVSMLMSSSM